MNHNILVVLVGDYGVGKKNLLSRFTKGEFYPNSILIPSSPDCVRIVHIDENIGAQIYYPGNVLLIIN
jgi:GTPase SAR1 family protein